MSDAGATAISADELWDLYAAGQFLSLERAEDGAMSGTLLTLAPGEIIADEVAFTVSRDELEAYPYDGDELFELGLQTSPARALRNIVAGSRLGDDTLPNRAEVALALRFPRDGGPATPGSVVRAGTRRILERFSRENDRDVEEATAAIRGLRPSAGPGLDPISRLVLGLLRTEHVSVSQATSILTDAGPLLDVPYFVIKGAARSGLDVADVTNEDLCRFLDVLQPGPLEYGQLLETGRLAAVHAERAVILKAIALLPTDPDLSARLIGVLENHACEDAFTVRIAVWCIGRHNDKNAIPVLVEMLGRSDMRLYRRDLERALQVLCSGSAAIPLAIEAPDAPELSESEQRRSEDDPDWDPGAEQRYWREQTRNLPAPSDADAWLRHDGESIFWEIRQRAAAAGRQALRGQALQRLQADAVAPVRAVARALS
jgi:hypothetical protein